MAIVSNTIIDSAGNGVSNTVVRAELIWDAETQAVAVSDDKTVFPTARTGTNSSGEWTLNLIPNEEITPAGSAWKITEGAGGAAVSYWIGVETPVDPDDVVAATDILVADPLAGP